MQLEEFELLKGWMGRMNANFERAEERIRKEGGTPGWGATAGTMDLDVMYWVRDVAMAEELPEYVVEVIEEGEDEELVSLPGFLLKRLVLAGL